MESKENSTEDYLPIAVLIEELKNGDIQLRLNSIRQLTTIALTLGAEKTRTRLITFLTETLCDEDEVLYALAEQVGSLVPYVGGPEYAYSLLPLLENLAAVEEMSVRDKAIECMRILATLHSPEAMEQYFYPAVKRLAVGEWQPSRVSSCALLSVVYPYVRHSDRCTVYGIMEKLASDESILVRRALASRLGEIAQTIVGGGREQQKSSTPPPPLSSTEPPSTAVAAVEQVDDVEMDKQSSDDPANLDGEIKPVAMTTDDPSVGDHISSSTGPQPAPPPPPPQLTESELSEARESIVNLLVPMFERFIMDKEETVRLYAVESIVGMCKALSNPTDLKEFLPSWILHLSSDDSWHVRCMFAEKVIDIFVAVDFCLGQDSVTPVYFDLLRDEESEVRAVAVSKIKQFSRCIFGLPPTPLVSNQTQSQSADQTTMSTSTTASADYITPTRQLVDADVPLHPKVLKVPSEARIVLNRLLQRVAVLVEDMNVHVRRVLASSVLGLAPLFGRVRTTQCLLPFMLKQLMDECPEVRFDILCNLDYINQVLDMRSLDTTLILSVNDLVRNPKWRVRLTLLDYLPSMADYVGVEVFANTFVVLFVDCLVDEVYAVREAAVQNIGRLGKKFGSEWTEENFIPNVLALSGEENYLHRMICLECIIQLSGVVDPSVCKNRLLPTLLTMGSDKVPNIRFKVAEALGKIGDYLDETDVTDQVKKCLDQLLLDQDADVQWFAYQAMVNLHLTKSPSSEEAEVDDDNRPGITTPIFTEAFGSIVSSTQSPSVTPFEL